MIRRKALVERLEPRNLLSAAMVADLNTAPGLLPGFWGSAAADNIVYLSHEDGVAGWELYKTDGTTAGTVLVKDIRPGRDNSAPSWFTQLSGETILFTADDGTNGIELWKSDGTLGGTVMVKDINPGAAASSPGNLLNVNGTIYFSANDGVNGFELWKSDGTAAGTVMVKNISTGSSGFPATPNSSSPAQLVNNNGTLFFRASTTSSGAELWKSDGTEAGTVMVKEIASGSSSGVGNVPMTARDGYVYFAGATSASGTELWRSNGTDPGTTMVKEIYASSTSSFPSLFVTSGNYVYFNVSSGSAPGLYRTDGTDPGTVRLFNASISIGVDLNGSLLFSQSIPAAPPATPMRLGLYKTDGISVTTIDAAISMSANTSPWKVANGLAYFTANTPTTGEELWKTDGTVVGTQMVADIESGVTNSNPTGIMPYGPGGTSGIIFSTFGGSTGGAMYRSNGTAAGTALLKDINPATGDTSPLAITPFKNWVYFLGTNPTYSSTTIGEMFRSDGTEAGTGIAVDLNPGPAGATVSAMKVMGDWLYFGGNDGSGIGKELWRTDGTTTQLVKNINPDTTGTFSSNPGNGVVSGNYLYFPASTGTTTLDEELWRTDGTNAGTIKLTSNAAGAFVNLMVDFNGWLYFTVHNSSNVFTGMFRTDGGVTLPVTTSFTAVSSMLNVNGTLYIAGTTSANGAELHKITSVGGAPALVKDINASGSASPANLTNVDGTLFFSATDGTNAGTELWKSDGTPAGTVMVKNIRPTAFDSSSPTQMVGANGVAYFRADNGVNGAELWRSDGTDAGTYMVKDITPAGASSGNPTRLFAANGFVYFAANDYNAGTPDAWRSDGTLEGTAPISQYPKGAFLNFPSNASFFAAMGGDVYYFFTDDTHGAELWKSEQPDFATLGAGNVLTVAGTGGNDTINLAADGSGNLTVTLNGLVETFAAGTVANVVIAGRVGVDTVNVTGGSVAFGGGDSGAATANLTVHVAAGAAATFAGTQQLAALVVDGGANATLAPSGNGVLVVGNLSLSSTGNMNINDNAMIIRGATMSAVGNLIHQGFNNGNWNGAGGISSGNAANDPQAITAVGFASNAVLNKTSFEGVTGLAPSDVLVKFTYTGDADLSGHATLDDFTLFLNGYQNSGNTWLQGDFDFDGLTDLNDFTLFLAGFRQQGPPL